MSIQNKFQDQDEVNDTPFRDFQCHFQTNLGDKIVESQPLQQQVFSQNIVEVQPQSQVYIDYDYFDKINQNQNELLTDLTEKNESNNVDQISNDSDIEKIQDTHELFNVNQLSHNNEIDYKEEVNKKSQTTLQNSEITYDKLILEINQLSKLQQINYDSLHQNQLISTSADQSQEPKFHSSLDSKDVDLSENQESQVLERQQDQDIWEQPSNLDLIESVLLKNEQNNLHTNHPPSNFQKLLKLHTRYQYIQKLITYSIAMISIIALMCLQYNIFTNKNTLPCHVYQDLKFPERRKNTLGSIDWTEESMRYLKLTQIALLIVLGFSLQFQQEFIRTYTQNDKLYFYNMTTDKVLNRAIESSHYNQNTNTVQNPLFQDLYIIGLGDAIDVINKFSLVIIVLIIINNEIGKLQSKLSKAFTVKQTAQKCS
eukprot:403340921